MSEIPDELVFVSEEFAAKLGMTPDAVKALSLRDLSNRAFDAGYELAVNSSPALDGKGKLRMVVETTRGAPLGTLPHD